MNETNSSPTIELKQRQTHLDVLKGLLILIVTLGHNRLFAAAFNSLHAFNFFYAFHVQSFFFVAAITNRRPLNLNGLSKRFKSYLYPQLIFFSLLSVVYYNFQKDSPDFHLGYWLRALISGSAPVTRAYCGVAYLWFLPALFGFYFVLSAYNSLQNTSLKILSAVGLFFLAIWLFALDLPMSRAPFGLGTAIYIVPISILVRFLYDRYALSWVTMLLSLIVVCVFYQSVTEAMSEIGAPKIFTRAQRSLVVIDILFMMACFFLLNRVSIAIATNKFLAYLGRNSLQVYLVHHIFNIVIIDFFLLRKKILTLDGDLLTLQVASILVFVIVVLLSTVVVWLSERKPVCWLFFPSKTPPRSNAPA